MIVLGIESSCDDTAIAVVSSEICTNSLNFTNKRILSNIVCSQTLLHEIYGGVFPEIASRAHLDNIGFVYDKALKISGVTLKDIDAISATCGPGLVGSLVIGASFGKALAYASGKNFIAVNHLMGHAVIARLQYDELKYPYLILLVSGGHTLLGIMVNPNKFIKLGSTIDDSAGECFDKVARMLGLPYPGGSHIENRAQHGDHNRFQLPMPLNNGSCDFSFSGLKTAVLYTMNKFNEVTDQDIDDMAASFQNTVARVLGKKVEAAILKTIELGYNIDSFVLAGGVASNKMIRGFLEQRINARNLKFYTPDFKLCTDNGAMIAWLGMEMLCYGSSNEHDLTSDLLCSI